MQRYLFLLVLFSASTAVGQQSAPGGVAGAKRWLISEVYPNGSAGWQDQLSGQFFTAEMASPPKEKSYLNFNPAYNFFTSAQELKFSLAGINGNKQTLFTVYQPQDTLSEKIIWSYTLSGQTQSVLTTHRLANLQKAAYMNFPLRRNGAPTISTYLQFQEGEQNTLESTLILARPPQDFQLPVKAFTGKLPELILYDRMLSSEERQRVESYLALKYGISLTPETDYLNSRGQVIYAPANAGNFIHRLAGIGRDDLSGLQQKQSNSSYSPHQLVISAGAQAVDNASNTTPLPDQFFLLWADNNQPFDWGDKQPLQPLALQHQWQTSSIGQWAQIPTEVRFDSKWLRSAALPGETYWLIIDRSGAGQFSTETPLDYYPLSQLLPDGKISFQDIRWDTDGSGKDVFTIATGPELLVDAQLTPPQCEPVQKGTIALTALGGRPPYRFQLQNDQGWFTTWTENDHSTHQLTDILPGNYHLLLTDADQREFRETFFFQSTDAPPIPLQQHYQLTSNQPLYLDAGLLVDPEVDYQWKTPQGQLINESKITITQPGTYQIQVRAEGCLAQQTVTVDPAAEGNFRQVELYPNPSTNGHFQLRVHLEKPADLALRVFDTAGRLLWQDQWQNDDYYQIRNQLLVKGTYLLQLQSAGSQISLPLIVQ